MADKYLNDARVSELWAAIKTALALKADKSQLAGYTTPEDMATAISSALANYATNNGVMAAIATALTNYLTATEVNAAIATAVADAAGLGFVVVETLPETGERNKIYLVAGSAGAENNGFDEYLWTGERFEKIGTTDMDLSGYLKKTDLAAMTTSELAAILV